MHIIGTPQAPVAIRRPQFVFFSFFFFTLLSDQGTFLRLAIIYDFSMILIVLFCLSTSRLGKYMHFSRHPRWIIVHRPLYCQDLINASRFPVDSFCHLHRAKGRQTGRRQTHRPTQRQRKKHNATRQLISHRYSTKLEHSRSRHFNQLPRFPVEVLVPFCP